MKNENYFVGESHNSLTITELCGTDKNRFMIVMAKCACGSIKQYRASSIRSGNTKSCGCLYKQIPGMYYTFRCGSIFRLPPIPGYSDEFCLWRNQNNSWICRSCMIIRASYWHAKYRRYTPDRTNCPNLVLIIKNQSECSACKIEFSVLAHKEKHLHHDHDTGEVLGFLCQDCNLMEGTLTKIGIGRSMNLLAYMGFITKG
jgi:5-methylcytosine-specific restriction endonuclease McrA